MASMMTINLRCVPRWRFWPAMKAYWFVLTVTGMATSKRLVDWLVRNGMRIEVANLPIVCGRQHD